MKENNQNADLQIRFAEAKDIPLVLSFVKALAEYEHLGNEVKATEDSLDDALFKRRIAEAVIAEENGMAIGFALFYYSLSTFIGKPGLFIEDLFVYPEVRGKGYGKTLLAFLAKRAKEKDCWGLEWACLDWNTPSIRFYEGIGAAPRSEWTIYRLRDEALDRLAGLVK